MIHLLFFNLILFYWMFSSVQSKVFSVLLHREKKLVSIFLQWKRKGNRIYEQQLKYLHVLDIIVLSNLHWFNSVGFKTSSTNFCEEWRDFHWLQWSFCLWKDSRVGSKGNKIRSYWISNIYIGQWEGIGIIVHWLNTFAEQWFHVQSQSNHIT